VMVLEEDFLVVEYCEGGEGDGEDEEGEGP